MATITIGYVTYDPEVTTDPIFIQWPSALDFDTATVEEMLWAGYDALLDMAAPRLLAEDPLTEATARRLYRGQVWLAKSNYLRMTQADTTSDEYGAPDLSRRAWLEARTILRPRDWSAIR